MRKPMALTTHTPTPVAIPHFPSRLHAYVWCNWQLVPIERLAQVVGAQPDDIMRLGRAMGLPAPRPVGEDQWRRSLITIIRRNWHLLPYEQLLALVGWTEGQLAFALREDDFLFIKLGSLKPDCAPLSYRDPDEGTRQRMMEIAAIVRREFPDQGGMSESLFSFVNRLSQPTPPANVDGAALFAPRFCYSYFALYGDPLLAEEDDLYPDGYLSQLAACGVDGVWLPAVLHTLAPFPWDAGLSDRYEDRVRALQRLVARVRQHGMGVYLYLNEPRALPLPFYDAHPALRGVAEDDHAALCTSDPEVQRYITDAVASICRAVPDLAGILTITASENLSNCWSHQKGEQCPRCGRRTGAEVIAEVNELIHEGIRQSGNGTRLLIWDWGWPDEWAEAIINRLPVNATLVSVSEWGLPISRGGVESVVGEYTLSTIGPGPRATRHWALARQRGLRTIAKIQAASTWELSALPYIPVVETTAQHIANLRTCQVDGLMLGWTLGGYPSPNLQVVAAMGRRADVTPATALEEVARRRFGDAAWHAVVQAWHIFSQAFGQFPFHVNVVYRAPLYVGPANPLWEAPTGYEATMLGFAYDDLDGWRGIYPPDVFARQLEAVATGFQPGVAALQLALRDASPTYRSALQEELNVAEAASLHLHSAARQARFVMARDALGRIQSADEAQARLDDIERMLREEIDAARHLYAIQSVDARIGFEASNEYYYVPLDLVEKAVNCYDLLDRWLPAQRAHWQEGRATTDHLGSNL